MTAFLPPAAADPGHPVLSVRTGRSRCARCARPAVSCLCAWVRPTAHDRPVLVLRHPLEARQAKGSATLLAASLQRCRLETGVAFGAEALERWLAELGPAPALLYPSTPALPPAPVASTPSGLVLIDATWRKSLRLLLEHPRLLALPRLALDAPPPSRYRVRAAQRPGQRSTLEAACLALGALEPAGAAAFEPLLAAFDGWVSTLAARHAGSAMLPSHVE